MSGSKAVRSLSFLKSPRKHISREGGLGADSSDLLPAVYLISCVALVLSLAIYALIYL